MTAEVAVINRSAIALAADSAVTIGMGSSAKIFQSANKLFQLVEDAPVAIMVYNSASFYGVPWEIIVKQFRLLKSESRKNHLFDWKEEFCNYLVGEFKPDHKSQVRHVINKLYSSFGQIRSEFFNSYKISFTL